MSARAYPDDGLPPESVRQDTETTALRRRIDLLERQHARLLRSHTTLVRRVSAIEGRERV